MKPSFNFNWLDLVGFIILARIVYIAFKKGFVIEFFKCLATFLGLFFSFHFHERFSDSILQHVSFLNKGLVTVAVFFLLYSFVWLVVRFIRICIVLLFRIEPHVLVERWFCLFLGIARAVVFVSILFFSIYLLSITYVDESLRTSFVFPLIKDIGPKSYKAIGTFSRKIFPNLAVQDIEIDLESRTS